MAPKRRNARTHFILLWKKVFRSSSEEEEEKGEMKTKSYKHVQTTESECLPRSAHHRLRSLHWCTFISSSIQQ